MINDSAIAKEKLLGLSEIDSEAVKTMTDKQLFAFVQALNVTAGTYPMQKEELEYAYKEADYASVFQWLNIIHSGLIQLHADDLASECEKFLDINHDMKKIRPERVKVFISYLLPNLELFFKDVHQLLKDLEVDVEEVETEKKTQHIDPDKIRDDLCSINELDADKINELSDAELSDYLKALSTYHVELQAMQNGLKGSIRIKNYSFVLQWLGTIEEALIKIHATGLASDCRAQIDMSKDFHNIRHEKLKVYTDYLLSTMSILSGDIEKLHLPKQLSKVEEKSTAGRKLAVDFETLAKGGSPDSKTILVVNKMKMFMNSLKNALSDTDYRIIGVKTAESTIGFLKNARPSLFIVDDDLPGTDSFLLIKIIRATGQMSPIIFTTSKITKDKMAKFVEAGVADFIMKPISIRDVQRIVEKHMH